MTTERFDRNHYYIIDGEALLRLWRVSTRMNDGMAFKTDERRDLAQEMQALLEGRTYTWKSRDEE